MTTNRPLSDMSEQALLSGVGRKQALIELESVLQNQVCYPALEPNHWYWQSSECPELVLLPKWFK